MGRSQYLLNRSKQRFKKIHGRHGEGGVGSDDMYSLEETPSSPSSTMQHLHMGIKNEYQEQLKPQQFQNSYGVGIYQLQSVEMPKQQEYSKQQQQQQQQQSQVDRQLQYKTSPHTGFISSSRQNSGDGGSHESEGMTKAYVRPALDEKTLQEQLERQRYEHEQQQLQLRQEQLRQQEQLRWQQHQLQLQQEQLRQQEQMRHMRQQQQIRNQKLHHQQRHQYQLQQKQLREQQQLLEQQYRQEHRQQQEGVNGHEEAMNQEQRQTTRPQDAMKDDRMDEQNNGVAKIRLRRGRWHRHQQLLNQLDDEESLHDLHNTITVRRHAPSSNASVASILHGVRETPLKQELGRGITIDVRVVSEALSFLDRASRLQIPEHLAATLENISTLPRGSNDQLTRKAIAVRQGKKVYGKNSESVQRSFSVTSHSSGIITSYSHYQQHPNMSFSFGGATPQHPPSARTGTRSKTSALSVSSSSSRSLEPKSTMTSNSFDDSSYQESYTSRNGHARMRQPIVDPYTVDSYTVAIHRKEPPEELNTATHKKLNREAKEKRTSRDASDSQPQVTTDWRERPEHPAGETTKHASRHGQAVMQAPSPLHGISIPGVSTPESYRMEAGGPHLPQLMEDTTLPALTNPLQRNLNNELAPPAPTFGLSADSGDAPTVQLAEMGSPSTIGVSLGTSGPKSEGEELSFPSLKISEALTISGNPVNQFSRREPSPSPSDVLMTYTLTENGEDSSLSGSNSIPKSRLGAGKTSAPSRRSGSQQQSGGSRDRGKRPGRTKADRIRQKMDDRESRSTHESRKQSSKEGSSRSRPSSDEDRKPPSKLLRSPAPKDDGDEPPFLPPSSDRSLMDQKSSGGRSGETSRNSRDDAGRRSADSKSSDSRSRVSLDQRRADGYRPPPARGDSNKIPSGPRSRTQRYNDDRIPAQGNQAEEIRRDSQSAPPRKRRSDDVDVYSGDDAYASDRGLRGVRRGEREKTQLSSSHGTSRSIEIGRFPIEGRSGDVLGDPGDYGSSSRSRSTENEMNPTPHDDHEGSMFTHDNRRRRGSRDDSDNEAIQPNDLRYRQNKSIPTPSRDPFVQSTGAAQESFDMISRAPADEYRQQGRPIWPPRKSAGAALSHQYDEQPPEARDTDDEEDQSSVYRLGKYRPSHGARETKNMAYDLDDPLSYVESTSYVESIPGDTYLYHSGNDRYRTTMADYEDADNSIISARDATETDSMYSKETDRSMVHSYIVERGAESYFLDVRALGGHHHPIIPETLSSAAVAAPTTQNANVIRSAYVSTTNALSKDRYAPISRLAEAKSRLRTALRIKEPKNASSKLNRKYATEDEDDLDMWLESAMASRSIDEGCGVDARTFADGDDADLDAWLDNVICR